MNEKNILKAKLKHIFFRSNSVKNVNIDIGDFQVDLDIEGDEMTVDIIGKGDIEEIENLYFEIMSLFFIYLGGFPQIMSMNINTEMIDLSKLAGKFDTAKEHMSENLALCSIDNTTINEGIIDKLGQINNVPIYSLQFLTSKAYKNIVTNHKITLILHALDGLIIDDLLTDEGDKIKNKYNLKHTPKGYKLKVFYLCDKYFFRYNKKFDADILKLLGTKEVKFVLNMYDTRHWNSHYFEEEYAPYKLNKGRDMILYASIIFYFLRIFVADLIGIKCDEEKIEEYCYILHDWILDIKKIKDCPVRSKTYKINQGIKQMVEFYHSYVDKTASK